MRHDWQVTGGYDPARDGPDPQWGRLAVRCGGCGDTRRIWRGLSLTDPGLTYGCPAELAEPAMWITVSSASADDGPRHPRAPAARFPAPPAPPAVTRRRYLGAVALALFGVLMGTGAALAVVTGTVLPFLAIWPAAMCEAGLITWVAVTLRRPGQSHQTVAPAGSRADGGVCPENTPAR